MIREYLKTTSDPDEIEAIAQRLINDATIVIGGAPKTFYTPLMLSKMNEEILRHLPQATPEETAALRL